MLLFFAIAIFSGAALLFLVQPMAAKLILPLLGGAPAVWNSCMLFFQVALLGGYLYAHLVARLRLRAQIIVHAGVLFVSLLALPIGLPRLVGMLEQPDQTPVTSCLLMLAMGFGAPFFALSAAGPLLQNWFARTDHPAAKDPYFLYAASNAGSMIALLGYPLLVEPFFPLSQQRSAWSIAFAGVAVVAVGSGVVACRRAAASMSGATTSPHATAKDGSAAPLGLKNALRIVALALVPSSLMLGTTQYLTSDIAAVPLLWVLPLAIYLLTFILAFGSRGEWMARWSRRVLPLALIAAAALYVADPRTPVFWVVAALLMVFFLLVLACHASLAALRPPSQRLTQYYLLIAVGGALGGVFNTLVAPVIFNTVVEYPIMVALAGLLVLWPSRAVPSSRARRVPKWTTLALDVIFPIAVLTTYAIFTVGWLGAQSHDLATRAMLAWSVPSVICLLSLLRPLRLVFCVAVFLALPSLSLAETRQLLFLQRSFFGVLSVHAKPDLTGGAWVDLLHGRTLHGVQYNQPPYSLRPTTYYTREGPAGDVIRTLYLRENHPLREAALVGMGAGTLAAHGHPGSTFTFFELDPTVVGIAFPRNLFTFIADSQAKVGFVLGDARLTLSRQPDARFDLIALDAFSSDAIPVHLLTSEAFEMYLRKLAPGGVILVHLTNTYLNLEPVLARIALALHLSAAIREDLAISKDRLDKAATSSVWAVLAPDPESIAPIRELPDWRDLAAPPSGRVWTDDYSDILSVIRR